MSARRKVVIGLSPRLLRQVPSELGFRGKTLQYLEQSMAHCVMRHDAVAVMIPTVERTDAADSPPVATADYVQLLDGLILQGGADIDPTVYGEERGSVLGPIDAVRDLFELELLRGFVTAGKPVLGVCRGMQLINVAFGGTLYQDLPSAGLRDIVHRVADLYDEHAHEIELVPGGWLQRLYGGKASGRVNSIHHQAVKRLGEGLVMEARAPDGVIECVRYTATPFTVGVQWHPEFHDERFPALLQSDPLLRAFLAAARDRAMQGEMSTSDVRRANVAR